MEEEGIEPPASRASVVCSPTELLLPYFVGTAQSLKIYDEKDF